MCAEQDPSPNREEQALAADGIPVPIRQGVIEAEGPSKHRKP